MRYGLHILNPTGFSRKTYQLLSLTEVRVKANPITLVILKSPSPFRKICRGRNINLLSIEECHSASPLGPPNPWLIYIAKETLGFRWSDISSDLRLLVPTFSLLYPPPLPYGGTSTDKECSPTPDAIRHLAVSSVFDLAPLHFRRKIS